MRRLRVLQLAFVGALTLCVALPAYAATPLAITPSRDALAVAKSIADRPSVVVGASFVHIPPLGNPVAISNLPLGEFPTSGADYAILSTGDATIASAPNSSGSSGVPDAPPGTLPYNGVTDATVLKIDLNVPANTTCMSFGFRFYSEEFPEFVGTAFNDSFVAELDANTWTASPIPVGTTGAATNISAPGNFAFDTLHNPISVNSIGDTSVAPTFASGTTYDAATRRLRASTPVTPGAHSLYLSIFDQTDRIYDSAVFIDRLSFSNLNPCVPGAAADLSQGTPAGIETLASGLQSIPADSVFAPAGLLVTRVDAPAGISRSSASTFKVTVRDSRGYLVRGAPVFVRDAAGGLIKTTAESMTDDTGVATFNLLPSTRLGAQKGRITLFVRARKPTGKIIATTTGRRLVSVKLNP